MHDRALVTKKNISTVLSELVDELVASIERARSILKGEKEKETWERVTHGRRAFLMPLFESWDDEENVYFLMVGIVVPLTARRGVLIGSGSHFTAMTSSSGSER